MNEIEWSKFLTKKAQRQVLMEQRKDRLLNLDIDITTNKFFRFFGSGYYFLKRLLTLIFGIALVACFALLFIYPGIILQNEEFKELLVEGFEYHYQDVANETVIAAAKNIVNDNTKYNSFIENVELAIHDTIEDEILIMVRIIAVLLLFIALFTLYLSRQIRKIHERNVQLSEKESVTQEIIQDYQNTIREEQEEYEILRQLHEESQRSKS